MPVDLRFSSRSGHWKSATAGLRDSGAARLLRAGERSSFEVPSGLEPPAHVGLTVSRRRPERPVRLHVSRDGVPLSEIELRAEPIEIRVPVARDSVRLELEAESPLPAFAPAFFVHEIVVDRDLHAARWLAWALPPLAGLIALLGLRRRLGPWLAIGWMLVTGAIGVIAAVLLWDPPAALRISPLVWYGIAVAVVAAAWLASCLTRRALGLPVLAPRSEELAPPPHRTFLGLTPRWALGVFGLAALLRLGFVVVVDQPLLYPHTYTYFDAALRIATHPEPVSYILGSEEWRLWHVHWTIAPLYYVALGLMLRWTGLDFFPVELCQGLLDSVTAIAVAALGRFAGGRHGAWAGVAYALYAPAVELTSWAMTEHLQTPLLVLPVAMVAAPGPLGRARHLAAGFLAGLGALARSVSIGLIGILVLWRADLLRLRRTSAAAALLVTAGAAAAILPWTARNVLIVGQMVLIEDNGVFNLWVDNAFTATEAERRWQEERIQLETDPRERRELAAGFVREGMERYPGRFLEKVEVNFWHFLRPEGLHQVLGSESATSPWQLAAWVVFDDLLTLAALPPFLVFLAAGRPSASRSLIAWWTLYYLAMVVVVFHNEIRYRSALIPFLLAGAAGGLAVLWDRGQWRRPAVWISLSLGLLLVGRSTGEYAAVGGNALRAWRAMALVGAAVEQGRLDDAWTLTERASAFAPGSGRPWRGLGRLLLWAGRPAEALEAYRRAGFRSNPLNQVATMGAARALRDLGRDEEADVLVDELNRHSRSTDPWPALESAWRELPPPRTDDVGVGWDSYGAVRGFHDPLGGEGGEPAHRWSRGRAWLRLSPKTAAASYQLVLEMGSPEPSPHPRPEVHVYVNGALRAELRLERELRPYRVEAPAPPRGAPLLVELRCSTWTAVGYPADRGVRVDRLRVRPSSPGPGPEMPAEPPGKIG